MHQARRRVCPNVQFHPEVVLVPLLHLTHLRVPLPRPVLGGGRRLDDGGVHYGALFQHTPCSARYSLTSVNQSLPQVVPLQQVAEMEDGALVGQRVDKPQPHEPAH